MVAAIQDLWQTATIAAGVRVKTLRGTVRGVIVKVLEDGKVVWRPDGSDSELIALPDSLLPELTK